MGEREQRVFETIEELARELPRFPDGRIDYSSSHVALTVTAFVKYGDKILLLKRSGKVRTYRGKWCAVAGYLDELKPIRRKALEEVQGELGIRESSILSIRVGKPYEFTDAELNITWIDHPMLVELKNKPRIELDWEYTEYRWIKPDEMTPAYCRECYSKRKSELPFPCSKWRMNQHLPKRGLQTYM